MAEPRFFVRAPSRTIREIAAAVGARFDEAHGERSIRDVAPLESARADELAYFENPRYLDQFVATTAGACLIASRHVERAPPDLACLITPEPYRAFATAAALFYPDALRPHGAMGSASGEIAPSAILDPAARLEEDVTIEPGAVIGPDVEIGRGTLIGARAVIGHGVRIGRDCSIGAGATIQHTLLGNRVIIHPGAQIGQDGFGFAMGRGHLKVPQVGRVIVQDDVEIGANSTIDRGATRDTVVGEGTKIDNHVQIGHNVAIGRHCLIAAQAGIAGSTVLGDYVAIGGQAGIGGHLHIGDGAQLAATSSLMNDIPAKARWGGIPAKPLKMVFRELAMLAKLTGRVEGESRKGGPDPGDN